MLHHGLVSLESVQVNVQPIPRVHGYLDAQVLAIRGCPREKLFSHTHRYPPVRPLAGRLEACNYPISNRTATRPPAPRIRARLVDNGKSWCPGISQSNVGTASRGRHVFSFCCVSRRTWHGVGVAVYIIMLLCTGVRRCCAFSFYFRHERSNTASIPDSSASSCLAPLVTLG